MDLYPEHTLAVVEGVRARWAKIVLGILFLIAAALFTFDFCAPYASWLLLVALGLLLAMVLTRQPSVAHVMLTALILLAVPVTILARWAPIHSLGWANLERVEVERINGQDHFEVTDPADLRAFEEFAGKGSHASMLKSGYGYRIVVWQDHVSRTYYFHGGAFGPYPGGSMQSIFIPAKPNSLEWFESLLARHGHPRRRVETARTAPATHPARDD